MRKICATHVNFNIDLLATCNLQLAVYRDMKYAIRPRKIERSADAFQGCHTLFLSPFEKLCDKPARVTGRQNAG